MNTKRAMQTKKKNDAASSSALEFLAYFRPVASSRSIYLDTSLSSWPSLLKRIFPRLIRLLIQWSNSPYQRHRALDCGLVSSQNYLVARAALLWIYRAYKSPRLELTSPLVMQSGAKSATVISMYFDHFCSMYTKNIHPFILIKVTFVLFIIPHERYVCVEGYTRRQETGIADACFWPSLCRKPSDSVTKFLWEISIIDWLWMGDPTEVWLPVSDSQRSDSVHSVRSVRSALPQIRRLLQSGELSNRTIFDMHKGSLNRWPPQATNCQPAIRTKFLIIPVNLHL
jgi:hypothetical protein